MKNVDDDDNFNGFDLCNIWSICSFSCKRYNGFIC